MQLTVKSIRDKKKKEKISVLTAYDYPTAKILDGAGIDILLVGDSLGMVMLGYESTVPVTMRDMLHHTKAVVRATRQALVVADMPFGSYDTPARALRNALRFMKEGGAGAVKLEGGQRVLKQVNALVSAGIPVMGHIGMTPQTFGELGGYKVQGKTAASAAHLLSEAKKLDRAGVFSLVLECVPASLGKRITRNVSCPVIGIGAGPATDGQVLVLHDMLGYEGKVKPRFVRRYAAIEQTVRKAASRFRDDVLNGRFPLAEESYS